MLGSIVLRSLEIEPEAGAQALASIALGRCAVARPLCTPVAEAIPARQIAAVAGGGRPPSLVEVSFGAFGRLGCRVNGAGVSVKSLRYLLHRSGARCGLNVAASTPHLPPHPGYPPTDGGGEAARHAEGVTSAGRPGTSEPVEGAVATMAAGRSPFTTGAAIQVEGGRHVHPCWELSRTG
jgi:hypothetical protein